ncbi:hypothetical protein [Streptomyces griseorubiginosus]|uniref:hypothetical protein n=1 Tax=Streptomyces griseorubiginosus TaxID=67304 RepID=UPI00215B46E5|nr:hypothetical protein [Streptomyces griseorubiginosus]
MLETVFTGTEQVNGDPPSKRSQRPAGYVTPIDANTADFDAAGMPTMQIVPTRA